ncbi:unnamed protein product [Effrenium voratum]|nr:unnamed protein product [Effrenium voratum]
MDLFTIDTKGSMEGLSQASRRELARQRLFPEKERLGLSGSEEAKLERELQRQANWRPDGPKAPELFDLWSTPTPAEQWKAEKADEQVGAFHIRKQPKYLPVHTPRTMHQKESKAPAVLPAHEGQSVNPNSEAYEDLACIAAAKALEKEEEAAQLERQQRPITSELRDTLGAEAVNAMDDLARLEAYRRLICPNAPEQQEGESEQAYQKRVSKFREKSQAHRNKTRKRKITDHKQAQLKAQQRLEKSVGEVGAILKEMEQEEAFRKERKAYRAAMREKRKEMEAKVGIMDVTTRLGRGKAPEEELAVPQEVAGTLRQTPVQASAAKDRLVSILRRGLLPASAVEKRAQGGRRLKKSLKFRHKKQIMSPLLRDNMVTR